MPSFKLRPDSLAMAVLLTALVAVGPVSTDLYLPALPTLRAALNTDSASMQLTLSVFLGGFAVSQLVYGPLSDRFGRRRVLLGGLVLYLAASLACLLASTIDELILGRFIQALGACSGPVLGRAIVRDVHGRERAAKVLAYMGTAMALAPLVAPFAGGYLLAWFGWRANFALLSLIGALLLAAVGLLLAETNDRPDFHALSPARMLENFRTLLTTRAFLRYALLQAFAFAGLFAWVSGSAFVLIERHHVPPTQFGWYFAMVVSGYMAGTFATGRLTMRLGIDRLIGIGSVLGAASGVAAAACAWAGLDALVWLMVPLVAYFLAVGLVLPNATAGALSAYAHMAGTASAVLGFLQMGIGALAGMVVGQFHEGSAIPMTTVIALSGLAAWAAFRRLATLPR